MFHSYAYAFCLFFCDIFFPPFSCSKTRIPGPTFHHPPFKKNGLCLDIRTFGHLPAIHEYAQGALRIHHSTWCCCFPVRWIGEWYCWWFVRNPAICWGWLWKSPLFTGFGCTIPGRLGFQITVKQYGDSMARSWTKTWCGERFLRWLSHQSHVSHEKRAPYTTFHESSWLVNRDPKIMVYYNPYIIVVV